MTKSGLPQSLKKHIRREKARIRREVFDLKKQEKLIGELYTKLFVTRKGRQQKPVDKQGNIISAAAEKMLLVKR